MRDVTANGIGYDVARVAVLTANGCAPDMSDDKDVFVNGNYPNVNFVDQVDGLRAVHGDAALDTVLPAKFAALINSDAENDDALPVLVYTLRDKLVAWYDCENCCGYISEDDEMIEDDRRLWPSARQA